MYGDLDAVDDPEFDICIKDDFGYGAVVGSDIGFGSAGWNFSWVLRYMKSGAETDEDPELFGPNITLDVDPWIVQVGVGKKW